MYNSQLRAHCNAVIRFLNYFSVARQESVSNSATAVIPTLTFILTGVLDLRLLSRKHRNATQKAFAKPDCKYRLRR